MHPLILTWNPKIGAFCRCFSFSFRGYFQIPCYFSGVCVCICILIFANHFFCLKVEDWQGEFGEDLPEAPHGDAWQLGEISRGVFFVASKW